jgi:transposase
MAKEFRDYNLDQIFLLPPDIRDWLPEKHRAWFISETIDAMDFSAIEAKYISKTGSGPRAYAPRMMLKLLVYGYCIGVRSSRKLERATFEHVAFRVLSGGQNPDHDTIARFRREHLSEVEGIFLQVLGLCKTAGLSKLGNVVLDGTKVKASANKSKSRTHKQVSESQAELKKQIREMLEDADKIDQEEDIIFGKGKTEEDLPEELWDRVKRLKKIEELKNKIEQDSHKEREKIREETKKRRNEDAQWELETGQKIEKRYLQEPGTGKKPLITESRRNPTDFDSRIMKDSQTGGYIQAYNCQAVVDEQQIILVAEVTNQVNDKGLAPSMMEQLKKNTHHPAEKIRADAGYFSERDLVRLKNIDCYIPPLERDKGKRLVEREGKKITLTEQMRKKLQESEAKEFYSKRKSIVEPVFGQIKEAQGFRQFLLRGMEKVSAEWKLIALCHNLNKLFTNNGGLSSPALF